MQNTTDFKKMPAFKYFEEICKIPHGSGNEKALADYIVEFAKSRGFYYYRDEYDTVLVRKPATKGNENKKSVLMQGHIDMVCEKDPNVEFDFLKDGIKLDIRDGFIYAQGTTLGADDGAAVAIMLSILDDKNFEAPEIECLFTSGEETALVGATHFDYSKITARRMINLDTECDGEAVAGSAGGVRCRIAKKLEYGDIAESEKTYKITIGGLKGGHSGCDIHLGRISATAASAKLLKLLGDSVKLCNFVGGNMDNAITRNCSVYVNTADEKHLKDICNDLEAMLLAKANDEDKGLFIKVSEAEAMQPFTTDFAEKFIVFVNEIPHGVCAMSRDMEGLVESSANFASVKYADDEMIISISMRSSVAASLKAMKDSLESKALNLGFDIKFEGEYPGWQYDPTSEMIQIYKDSYQKISGKEGRVVAIHAGLECGVVKSNIPDMDIVSVGPNIYDVHTPNEHMEIESFLRFNDLLRLMIN